MTEAIAKEQHIVKGTPLKGAFPVEGNGCLYCILGDSYGYLIGKVINNGEMFEVLHKRTDYDTNEVSYEFYAMLVLVTRKNSRHRGWYVEGKQDKNGKWKATSDHENRCGGWHVLETKGCPSTHLDPHV